MWILKIPCTKSPAKHFKKRLPGEDLLMWDFPGKLYYAFGRDMLQKLFEGRSRSRFSVCFRRKRIMNCRSFWQIRHFICRNLFFLRLHTERTGQKTCWRRSMRKQDSWEAAAVMRNCLYIWQTGSSMRIQ